MRRSKTLSLLAFVATATALLYRPAVKLLSDISPSGPRRSRRMKKVDENLGKFANHYLGSNRHHSRKASRRKPLHTS